MSFGFYNSFGFRLPVNDNLTTSMVNNLDEQFVKNRKTAPGYVDCATSTDTKVTPGRSVSFKGTVPA